MKTKKTNIIDESSIVDALKEKYKKRLARAEQELKADEKRMKSRGTFVSDVLLFSKWAYRVGKGWYGFNLGHISPVWMDILNDFLSWLEIECPDFEIHQVKITVSGLRLYLGTKTDFVIPNEKIRSEIRQFQNLLNHPPMTQIPIRAARKERQSRSRKP